MAPTSTLRHRRHLDRLARLLTIVGCAGLLACAPAQAATPLPPSAPERALTGGPAWQLANDAYKAYDNKDYVGAQKKAEQALALRPDVSRLWLLLVYALQNQDKPEDALRVAQQALSAGHGSAELIAARNTLQAAATARTQAQTIARQTQSWQLADSAYKAYGEHDYPTAIAYARQASEQAPENISYRLLLINALALSGQTDQAREAMQVVLRTDTLPPDTLLDAAYAAQRLGYNDQASAWFSSAIDANHAGRIKLDPQQVYNIRRASTDLERTWGLNAGLGYGTMGVENTSFAPALSRRKSLQTSTEIYWRPPVIGSNDGRTVELYARAGQTLYDGTGGATGASTLQGAAGARWKPFGRQNFVFAAEYWFPIGSASRRDWLLRAAWSDGEGGDLRVDTPDWRYWQIYAEADRFLLTRQSLGTLEARYGRSFLAHTISNKLVVTPFVSLAANYDSTLETPGTLGIGPGIGIRYWFREDAHHAPASFVDINVQYRFHLAGDDRSNGVFANLYFSY